MTEKKKTKSGIKQFTKSFWALSRPRQEAFLRNLYDLSPENKSLFRLRLGEDKTAVFQSLKKDIQKETIGRIGKFKKIRLSKINTILRNADKYALPILQQIELKKEVWTGMLAFILSKRWLPENHQVACARHLDQYLTMVRHHILETSASEEILKQDQELLIDTFSKGTYLPHIEDVYLRHFQTGSKQTL